MTVQEYNAMHEAKGTPRVWCVDSAFFSGELIHSRIFATEEEAQAAYDRLKGAGYRKMYRTWDIWHWMERKRKEAANNG